MPLNAHIMVLTTARDMANELFEVYARSNDYYRALRLNNAITERKARRIFVNRIAPKLYEYARQALTQMLAQPDEAVPVSTKDAIAEALILDNDLRGNRMVATERATVPKHLQH
jgi:hypothetical protein